MLQLPSKLVLKTSLISAPNSPLLKFIVSSVKAYQKFCQNWLQGLSLAEQNLEGIDFSSYYQDWQSLKGTDFSQCNLRHSNFKGVIGGFSVVRPVLLLVVLGFAWLLTVEVSPNLNEILETLGNPNSTEIAALAMIFLPSFIFLLKMLAEFLSGSQLPPQFGRGENSVDFWKKIIKQLGGITLIFVSVWLLLTAYLSVTLAPASSTEQKISLLVIVILLIGAALAILFSSFKRFFRFHTSFIQAELEGACFIAARFPGCNFSKANLHAANLQKGSFCSCNFNGADLRAADFRGADLSGVSFKGAKTDGAIGLKEAIYGTGR